MLMSLDLILAFLEPSSGSLARRGGSGSYPQQNILLTKRVQIYFKHKPGICSSRTNKAPQTLLSLLDAQQPSALGNIFKSLSGLTNAATLRTKLEPSEGKSSGWGGGNGCAGNAESRGEHWDLSGWSPRALLSGKDAAPTKAPGNTWSKGPEQWLGRSWEGAQIEQVLRRTGN